MIHSLKSVFTFWVVLSLSLLLLSCGGGGSGSSGGTGTLELKLTDASTEDYQAVYVTIAEVQVHRVADAEDDDSGWQAILTPDKTYNLLELVNGVFETLGIAELAAGKYNQMRLILSDQPDDSLNIFEESHPLGYGNYLIDSEDEYHYLKVPSGFPTGIKIVKGFTIFPSQATELILDFDAARSVVHAGKKYLLKPTIKVLETVENFVGGVVDDGAEPIGGALISAQIYDAGAADPKDEVTVETTTVSTEEGAYKLFLPLNTYNIVATKYGYLPACQEVEAEWFDANDPVHFSLTVEAAIILISGTVSGLATEDSALLSIRQLDVNCGGAANVTIEAASLNVANGDYSITLPAGTYDVVVSAEGETTQVSEDISADTDLDIIFGL